MHTFVENASASLSSTFNLVLDVAPHALAGRGAENTFARHLVASKADPSAAYKVYRLSFANKLIAYLLMRYLVG